MLNLPEKKPLAADTIDRINGTQCQKVLMVPTKEGGDYPCAAAALVCRPDSALTLALEQEHSELGRGLVRSLWFSKPLTLYVKDEMGTLKLTLRPWRCHIAGVLFAEVLQSARAKDPEADPTAVWELYPEDAVETNQPFPTALPLHSTGEPEHHLDHPSLHR